MFCETIGAAVSCIPHSRQGRDGNGIGEMTSCSATSSLPWCFVAIGGKSTPWWGAEAVVTTSNRVLLTVKYGRTLGATNSTDGKGGRRRGLVGGYHRMSCVLFGSISLPLVCPVFERPRVQLEPSTQRQRENFAVWNMNMLGIWVKLPCRCIR
eukprot:scaffold283121_cov28-Tisochrysis_lutea.AAC.1